MTIQDRRVGIINKIFITLQKVEGEFDVSALILNICDETGCSIRTAREYYKIARGRYEVQLNATMAKS